jgi:hypothetical protein
MTLKAAPSKEAVVRYLNGEEGAGFELVKTFVERTGLIAVGIYLLGDRNNLVRNSLSASLAIELYLLWYYSQQMKENNTTH